MGKLDILAKTLQQKSVLESIQIRNFKAIKDEPLTLNNLTNVNYLVGENGSGKSSVLEYLYLDLKNHKFKNNLDELLRVQPFSQVSLTKKSNIIHTFKDYEVLLISNNLLILPNYLYGLYESLFLTPITEISQILKNISTEKRKTQSQFIAEIVQVSLKKYGYVDLQMIKFIGDSNHNVFLRSIATSPFTDLKNMLADFFKLTETDRQKILNEKFRFYSKFRESNGESLYLSVVWLFIEYLNIFSSEKNRVLICIDELENGFHPNLQKSLPSLFEVLLKIAKESGKEVKIMISTHSPFIISAAGKIAEKERLEGKDPSQKVYLIEDGQTRDLFGELGKGNKGYAGGDCINVVNEMLGSDLSDYFGGLCFLAEKSVCAFLMGLKENIYFKDKIKPFTFILSNKGDESGKVRQSEQMRNQAYSYSGIGNFKVILDKDVDQNFWKPYQDQFPDHWILLDRDEIEPLYGQKVINSFLSKVKNLTIDYQDSPNQAHAFKEFCKANSLEDKLKIPVGKLKVELGEFAGENIDEDTFKVNFGDLADLIFNQNDF